MGRIIIYTTTGCPYSLKVKNIFEKKTVQFTEINLTEFPTVVDELADWSKGKRSIPQIFFEDEFIGVRIKFMHDFYIDYFVNLFLLTDVVPFC
jgi:glutaredoxin 3